MRRSTICATFTCLAFVWATLWPNIVRAADAAPPPAATDDATMATAKQHFEAGRVAYGAADFPTAIREFKAAEALRPSPILAYNIGLANEKLGRRRVAVRYYKRYLETSPNAANKAEVDGRISSLEAQIAAQPQMQPGEQPQDNPPPQGYMGEDPNNPPPPTVQAGGDPYAPQPPGMTAPGHKRKKNWWIGLVVGLSVAVVVTAVIVALVVVYTRDNTEVYYAEKIPALDAIDRTRLLDRAALPSQARGAEIAPLYQVHF